MAPTILGFIPARAGSKRLPRKNIRPLDGKPLIVWTIEAAQASKLLDKIVCSTDDEDVARICADHGVPVVQRPPELATDTAEIAAAALHALETHPADYVCLLQPTSPFRTAEDIDHLIRHALRRGSVHTVSTPMMQPNGAVYVVTAERLKQTGFGGGYSIPVNGHRFVDIDTEEDFREAERLAQMQKTAIDWDG